MGTFMKSIFLFILIFSFFCDAFSAGPKTNKRSVKRKKTKKKRVQFDEKPKTEYRISLGLLNRYFDEKTISSGNLFGIHLGGELSRFLDEEDLIKAYIQAHFLQEFGVSQDRFGENLPQNGINISNAFVDFTIFDSHLIVGALSQSDIDEPLIIQNQVFPGARFTYRSPQNGFKMGLQVSMPTSNDLKDGRVENEQLPLAYRGVLSLNSDFGLNIESGLYYFSNLPSKTAEESATRGNSVNTITREKFSFKYDYQIASTRVIAGKDVGLFRPELSYLIFKNLAADDSFSLGQEVSMGIKVKNSFLEKLKIAYYFVESDASVATYSSYEVGHNNRSGYMVTVSTKMNENLLVFKFVSSETINPSIYQKDLTYFSTSWKYNF